MNEKRAWKPWSIEADASLQASLERPGCPPLLVEALSTALDWQTRNETPVRKALTSPRVAPQWVAALLALGATVVLDGGERPKEVALETLLKQGKGKASSLHVPSGSCATRWGEAHVARTPAEAPIVAAYAVVEVEGGSVRRARVALTGVWPEPARLAEASARLVGGPLDAERIRAAAEAVVGEVAPKGDFLGSEAYRRAMAGVLTRRALEACLRQEAGDE